jgi:hypothetical protein
MSKTVEYEITQDEMHFMTWIATKQRRFIAMRIDEDGRGFVHGSDDWVLSTLSQFRTGHLACQCAICQRARVQAYRSRSNAAS